MSSSKILPESPVFPWLVITAPTDGQGREINLDVCGLDNGRSEGMLALASGRGDVHSHHPSTHLH